MMAAPRAARNNFICIVLLGYFHKAIGLLFLE
jgi:hypothetical protein